MESLPKELVEKAVELIPKFSHEHSRESEMFQFFDQMVTQYFSDYPSEEVDLGPVQKLAWPHRSLGNLTSYDCFTLNEFLCYKYYQIHAAPGKVAFDVGANIGTDTIIMAKLGYDVHCFEPDPNNVSILNENIKLNHCQNIHVHQAGLSDKAGETEFVFVKGNTTASHIAGDRDFYGDYDSYKVKLMTIDDVGVEPDLMKINVEGHEKVLIPAIPMNIWKKADVFIELHGDDCRQMAFDFFKSHKINMFTQKLAWQAPQKWEDLPVDHREGYLFVSPKSEMDWRGQ